MYRLGALRSNMGLLGGFYGALLVCWRLVGLRALVGCLFVRQKTPLLHLFRLSRPRLLSFAPLLCFVGCLLCWCWCFVPLLCVVFCWGCLCFLLGFVSGVVFLVPCGCSCAPCVPLLCWVFPFVLTAFCGVVCGLVWFLPLRVRMGANTTKEKRARIGCAFRGVCGRCLLY